LLSIIIVNYNVKYFLEQCLCAVQKAMNGIEAEVIVTDNNSTDGSVAYLQPKFPWVIFVSNNQNTGYAKASNQGWRIAKGEHFLFLNPDTILSEDSLKKSLAVLQEQPRVGALGIRMIDGSGQFLPESKRGFPTAAASFYKLSGLTKLFPHSKIFAKYYLGHLPEKENNEIDVISGSYFMFRKQALEKTGGFDEKFFMYGEDIDLSYRIQQAGYTNYYLAGSTIIHFKGESTRKDIKYVKLFYKAMNIFVKKHYGRQSWWFVMLLQIAIGCRSVLSFTGNLFSPRKQSTTAGKLIHTVLAGTEEEIKEIQAILTHNKAAKRNIQSCGSMPDIFSFVAAQKADEIIFCTGITSYTGIIICVQQMPHKISFKFHATGSSSIVGSTSKKSSGEAMAL
jgi:N-acetylglucosaminyl-diphospho-decaprenol L-rhamnosyltransferase